MNINEIIYIHAYEYIYCHTQTNCFVVSQLFSVTRHVGRLKRNPLDLVDVNVRLSIIPLSPQANHVSSGIIYIYIYNVGGYVCV